MSDTDVLSMIDGILRWVTPLLAAIITLIIFIYKSKMKELEQKIEEEKEERKEDTKNIIGLFKSYREERKDIDKELLQGFSEIIKEERNWKLNMDEKQSSQFSLISTKIENLNVCINRTAEKIENYMGSQEKICEERHKWNGVNRRYSKDS